VPAPVSIAVPVPVPEPTAAVSVSAIRRFQSGAGRRDDATSSVPNLSMVPSLGYDDNVSMLSSLLLTVDRRLAASSDSGTGAADVGSCDCNAG
jgi:hypothetical protein